MARPYTNGERLRMCEELIRRGATCSAGKRFDAASNREVVQFELSLGDLTVRATDFFECIDMLLDSLFEAWGVAHAAAGKRVEEARLPARDARGRWQRRLELARKQRA